MAAPSWLALCASWPGHTHSAGSPSGPSGPTPQTKPASHPSKGQGPRPRARKHGLRGAIVGLRQQVRDRSTASRSLQGSMGSGPLQVVRVLSCHHRRPPRPQRVRRMAAPENCGLLIWLCFGGPGPPGRKAARKAAEPSPQSPAVGPAWAASQQPMKSDTSEGWCKSYSRVQEYSCTADSRALGSPGDDDGPATPRTALATTRQGSQDVTFIHGSATSGTGPGNDASSCCERLTAAQDCEARPSDVRVAAALTAATATAPAATKWKADSQDAGDQTPAVSKAGAQPDSWTPDGQLVALGSDVSLRQEALAGPLPPPRSSHRLVADDSADGPEASAVGWLVRSRQAVVGSPQVRHEAGAGAQAGEGWALGPMPRPTSQHTRRSSRAGDTPPLQTPSQTPPLPQQQQAVRAAPTGAVGARPAPKPSRSRGGWDLGSQLALLRRQLSRERAAPLSASGEEAGSGRGRRFALGASSNSPAKPLSTSGTAHGPGNGRPRTAAAAAVGGGAATAPGGLEPALVGAFQMPPGWSVRAPGRRGGGLLLGGSEAGAAWHAAADGGVSDEEDPLADTPCSGFRVSIAAGHGPGPCLRLSAPSAPRPLPLTPPNARYLVLRRRSRSARGR